MLPSIALPTLVVVGRDDAITPLADAELMASAIPGATGNRGGAGTCRRWNAPPKRRP